METNALSSLPKKFKISWSAILAYDTCPLTFYHQYILGVQSPTNIFALSGCAVHELLKHIYTINNFNSRYSFKVFSNIFDKELETPYKQIQYGSFTKEEINKAKLIGFKQIKDFFAMAEKNDLLRPSVFNDLTIVRSYKKIPCKVKIDTAFNFPNVGLVLVDWKSGKADKKYLYQLIFYAAVYEKEKNCKVKGIAPIYFTNPWKIHEITDSLKKEVSEYISNAVNGILANKFEPKKHQYCENCFVRQMTKCPLYKTN